MNKAALVVHGQKSYQIDQFRDKIGRLSNLEELIFESREDGLSFCQLDETGKKHAIDQIILRGSAVCGCPVPETEYFAGIIGEEVSTFIEKFGYGNLNLAEILLAIRMNAKTDIRFPSGNERDIAVFSGGFLNIIFLGKVLTNYLIFRNLLDSRIKNAIDGF